MGYVIFFFGIVLLLVLAFSAVFFSEPSEKEKKMREISEDYNNGQAEYYHIWE